MDIDGPLMYEEKQRFNQPWLIAICLLPLIVISFAMMRQIVFKMPFGNNPPPDAILILIFAIFFLEIPLMFFVLSLTIKVTTDGFYYKFFPFHLSYKKIEFESIKQCYAREYRPIIEYGGWGVRYSLKYGKAYNVKGNKGVQLVLRDGSKILFGTQNADELELAIRQAGGKRLTLEENTQGS